MNEYDKELRELKDRAVSYVVWLSAYSERRVEVEGNVKRACKSVEENIECQNVGRALLNLMDVEAMLDVMDIAERKIRSELRGVLVQISELNYRASEPWESRS